MSDDAPLVLYETDDAGVMTVRFNRPERNNAWSIPLENEYFALLDQAAVDTAVRAVVVTGVGRAFCPGMDTQRLGQVADAGGLDTSSRRPMFTPRNFPKPLIAAINGACAGIGLVQACFADVRFVARTAKISTAFARRGLSAEYGLGWMLPRLIGPERALDLLLSGRTITGEEMHALGLATRLCDVETVVTDAQAYARELAVWSSPRAMAAIRHQVNDYLDCSFDDAWQRVLVQMDRYAAFPDFREGIASFVEKRAPRFEPLPSVFSPTAARGDS